MFDKNVSFNKKIKKRLNEYTWINMLQYLLTLCNLTYLFLRHWIDSSKSFLVDWVHIFIIDKKLSVHKKEVHWNVRYFLDNNITHNI